jgi:uncharacterized damage-inducible protein DinB
MPTIELIRAYMEYNDAMNRKVWDSIMTLSDEHFIENLGYSHGSIRDLMVHMAVVDGRWLRGLKEEPEARGYSVDPASFPTRQKAFEFWDQTAHELMAYTQSLEESDLSITPMGMYGPVWQVLLHLVNHGTDHRSQVLRALTDFEAPTFDQDFILFEWFKQ